MQTDSKYVSFDPERCGSSNITGIYSNPALAKTQNVVLISGLELSQYRNAPNDFGIDQDKRFTRINRAENSIVKTIAQERNIAKNDIIKPIQVDLSSSEISELFEYIPDMTLQLNLMSGLHLTLANKSSVCRLWCRSESGDWLFKDHSYEQLIKVAKAINARREAMSENVYATF
jgi:hypothetical protein